MGMYGYQVALFSVRPQDPSGLLLQKVLHEVRFFVGVANNDYTQNMITRFVDKTFADNIMHGTTRELPLGYKEVLEIAKVVTTVMQRVDSYSVQRRTRSQISGTSSGQGQDRQQDNKGSQGGKQGNLDYNRGGT